MRLATARRKSLPAAAAAEPVAADAPARRRLRPRVAWMVLLFMAICLEGLGRKWVPSIPQGVFYFLKDAVLLFGLVAYGLKPAVLRTAKSLYRGFVPVLVLAVAWTVFELANPSHASFVLGLIGLRSYWLWWLAPLIIASALEDIRDYEGVVLGLAAIAGIVAVFAALQFVRPADDALNVYASHEGQDPMNVAIVAETGRARVSATFSFITGFTDFSVLVPPVIFAIGLHQKATTRLLALVAAGATAAVMPTSGSRGPVILGMIALLAVAWGARLFATKNGRWALVGIVVVTGVGIYLMPDAVEGVRSRFTADTTETESRALETLDALPPVALARHPYEPIGIGTGMQHNSRFQFGVPLRPTDAEGEVSRILQELGPFGYLLVWIARLGLAVALLRASARFKRAGLGGFRGLAIAYAALLQTGFIVMDHIYSALYFVGMALILRAAVACEPAVAPTAAPPRPLFRRPRVALSRAS